MRLRSRIVLAVLLLAGGASCADRGREVFVASGCPSCHRFRGAGGSLGPDLSDAASRLTADDMAAQITRPASRDPANRMPAFDRLSGYDLRSVIAYLRSPAR